MEFEEDGYELAARFSYITNALCYCGPKDDHKVFYDYIAEEGSILKEEMRPKILHSIKRFEALYPYLKFIAEKSGKDVLDKEIVKAYWIGNSLLEKFSKEDMQELIGLLVSRGLPESLGKKLSDNMPTNAIPYHTFHVLYVGVGNVTGHVETNIQNMDNCRISAGKILDIIDTHLIVKTDSLVEKSGKIYIQEDDTKTIIFDKKILASPKPGDLIAIHWGFACKKLSLEEYNSIIHYTKIAIDTKNKV